TKPVALHGLQNILRGEVCSPQPVGSAICREHALGGVDGQDDIATVLLEILFDVSELRPGEGQDQRNQGAEKEKPLDQFAGFGHGIGEFRQQTSGDQLFETLAAPTIIVNDKYS